MFLKLTSRAASSILTGGYIHISVRIGIKCAAGNKEKELSSIPSSNMFDRLTIYAIVTVLAVTMLLSWQEAVARGGEDDTAAIFGLADQVAQEDSHRDTVACETVFYSGLCDQWLKAYEGGRTADAERAWAKILAKIGTSDSCYLLLRKLHQRLESDAPEEVSNSSKYGILQFTNTILKATEKNLGPNHRFIADILAFMTTHYDSIKDYKTALPLRQREMEVSIKSTGAESEMSAYSIMDMAYELAELGRYQKAHQLVTRVLKFSRAHNYQRALPLAIKLDSQINSAMQRKGLPIR
jgi:tetratricopeptide (TPR) repeat protein